MGKIHEILVGLTLLTGLILAGTYFYHVTEGLEVIDAFHYTFFTITSVGSHFVPTTTAGKLFGAGMVFLGMGTAVYLVTLMARIVIEGQTIKVLTGLRGGFIRMKKEKNHVIICGYGRLGEYASENLIEEKEKLVVIEKDPEKVSKLLNDGIPVIQGDALDVDVLKQANLAQAKVLIATLGEDADNIYLIMTATELNPKTIYAASADTERAVNRLHKVGAQIVVVPDVVGGEQLAKAVLQLEKTKNLSTIRSKNN
ncbi:potassium channel family protein [Candidatus Woesearchaeota archaeon]|nr:potassium channel family protein [Candidatus Woesearchaeota archaeon]